MSHLTPPPGKLKTRGFFKKYTQPTYYEDLHGTMNKDEAFDRYPDNCESESDDDHDEDDVEEEETDLRRSKRVKVSPRRLRSREMKGEVRDRDDGEGGGLFVSEDEQENDGEGVEVRHKIAPNINSRQSIQIPLSPKMTPKKFGMFGGGGNRQYDDLPTDEKHAETKKPTSAKNKAKEVSGRRIKRPAGQELLKKQLADKARSRKEALRAERDQRKKGEKKNKEIKGKPGKTPHKQVHWNDIRHQIRAKLLKQAEKKKLYVLIDNSGIDMNEYERFDD